ncbi:MAG TPA: amidophosphoribosyltransferase [bacterium]|nr:amidophosphoribosyltransferase [bacterium]HOY44249.1 amidophosphoribosyltransferase [bacterium]HPG83378.1 amidophosphoribosyltransferase [bacterium]HPM58782.1 amidophosphoribosyltransferase [bacterium]
MKACSLIDKARCNCAVVGVYGTTEASRLAYLALYAQQHRGQESSGIVASDGRRVNRHVGRGLVADVFSDQALFATLGGHMAIGHNRYSTTGASHLVNAQPLVANFREGPFAVSHNGNFTNAGELRRRLEEQGSLFQTTTDTEVVLHLIARSRAQDMTARIAEALLQIEGAYSLVMMCNGRIYAARDPHGVRPLCLGHKEGSWFVASETCALDLLRAEIVRDIEPGELIEIHDGVVESHRFAPLTPRHACIFEFVYFSRPDSRIFNENVDRVRRRLGKNLALESPAEADIVISVPDSSNTAAVGYSRRTGIKFELGLIRNHYVGRTFIHPQQDMRDFNVRIKFNPVKGVLQDRRVVVIEDSIVRGTTLRQLVSLIRQAGAREVHVRVSSPPIISPCYYGMDFPSTSELIAAHKSVEEIRAWLQCDSLAYLSLEGLLKSVAHDDEGYCAACFTGEYPIPVEDNYSERVHEPL